MRKSVVISKERMKNMEKPKYKEICEWLEKQRKEYP